jgi:DNA helicase HerA-like ATPase
MPYDVIVGRNESDKKAFGKKGLIFLGKSYVTMGQYTSLSNPVYMDVARSHVIMIAGKRGSGKSYTLGGMAEAISDLNFEEAQNVSSLIFDTMGIFWTMKFKNHKDKALLFEWGLEEKNIPVRVYVPFGYYNQFRDKGIPIDGEFAIKLSDLEADDWISLFGLKFTQPEGVLIETIVSRLKEKGNFSFEDIRNLARQSEEVSQDIKNAVISLFNAAETWKLFDEKIGTPIKELIVGGKTTVIDLSMYASSGSFNVRGLVIGLVCKKLFNERMSERRNEEIQAVQRGYDMQSFSVKREMPLVWIFIDEAHEFLPRTEDGKTPATDALIQLLREGRQPGISLVLATQQPGKIHTDAMTQSDIVLSHRVTAEQDVNALNSIMQTYLYEGIKEKMNNLPHLKGSAILLDDNSERIYPIRVRPRFTWHGGDAPSAVREEKIE